MSKTSVRSHLRLLQRQGAYDHVGTESEPDAPAFPNSERLFASPLSPSETTHSSTVFPLQPTNDNAATGENLLKSRLLNWPQLITFGML